MAPNVELHFWPANDLNGDSILQITDEDEYLKEVKLRITLDELGFGEFTLARRVGFALFDSGAVQPEVFVRVLVHAYSSTEYLWGFFLDKREQVVIHKDEEGGEEFRFGGPGPKFYLDRAALQPEQFTGTGWLIDLANGVFRWDEDATAGKVLNKLILEDAASDAPALPDLTKSFTNGADSDSVSWTTDIAGPGEFELPIGQSFLTDLWELEDLSDLRTTIYLGTVSDPVFRLDAWNAYGEDVSGSAFGAGVCRLVEGVNIAEDSLTVKGTSLRKASHVIVKGKDGVWVTVPRSTWDPGEYVKYATINYTRSSNPTILTRAGLRWLRKQDNGEKQITVEILPGADDATGLYFPKPTGPLWIGNTIALHTGGDVSWTPLDYRNEDQLVTGLELELLPASVASDTLHKTRSWKVRVQLNYERGGAKSPGQGTSEGGSPVGGVQLCRGVVCRDIDTSVLDAVAVINGDAENGSGTEWSGGSGYSTSLKYAGSRSYVRTSSASCDISLALSGTFEAGVRYVLDCWLRALSPDDHDTATLSFGVDGGDEAIEVYVGGAGSDPVDLYLEYDTGADGATWTRARVCWTPTADRTGVRFRYQDTAFSSASFAVDEVTIHEGPADPNLVGTSARAAPCDHRHIASDVDGLPTGGGAIDFGEAGDISTQAFGDSPAAGSTGEVADAGHLHGMPADPVTAHVAAADPHGQYVQTGGGGSLVGHPVSIAGVGVPLTGGSTLAVTADRGDAIPIIIPEVMYLRGLAIRTTVTGSGTVEWGLFDYSVNPAACTKVAGGSGALSATGYFLLAATGAPVTVQPGNYMLIIKWPATNRPTVSTESTASTQAGSGMKVITTYTWDDTPDLTTGWAGTSLVLVARLVGDLTGSGAQW